MTQSAAYPPKPHPCLPDHDYEVVNEMKQTWRIRIQGYGTFDFEGTEAEAEEMRAHKSRWERGSGIKWRTTNQKPSDKLREQQAALWDAGDGVPMSLMKKLREALADEAATP